MRQSRCVNGGWRSAVGDRQRCLSESSQWLAALVKGTDVATRRMRQVGILSGPERVLSGGEGGQ